MDTVRVELRRLAHNSRAHSFQDFKNIYSFISEHLSAEDSKLAVKAPPPELLAQLGRNLIHPDILVECIPDLLEALANIERWRRKVWERADLVLVSDKYWHDYSTGLTETDKRVLQAIVDSHEVIRINFVEISRQYCHWHLHHIWAHGSVNEFLQTFNRYFPMLANTAQAYPFLQHLDAPETSKFADSGKVWVKFISDWLTKLTEGGPDPKVEVRTEEELQRETTAYLTLVQKQIDTLEKILDKEKYEYRIRNESRT
ncbi:hypothetical protein GYMLUDRAFT_243856 [Collybiopsis luxurians FD-317 M1]|uniref:Uncharacterized protein n=1 Tax=Collybiopsis luxurians FD-317 M1 TaxID=944289 RepID=A0A0D0CF46_9AGAR|nr:hypothetical protein GYMLUDRAFT_243856 [Collybiopsis luxurians FD-317 M1]